MDTATGNAAPPEGLWVTISDLARRQNITKGPLSRRVARLEAQGALQTRAGNGGTKLVNVAQFLKAIDQTADLVRETNGAGPRSRAIGDTEDLNYSREQARRTALSADLADLDLQERLGKLLPTPMVEQAMERCGGAMVRALEQLVSRSEDLASAVAKGGVNGARTFLREEVRRVRAVIAAELKVLMNEEDDRDSEAA